MGTKRYLSWGKVVHIDSDSIKVQWKAKKEPTEHRPQDLQCFVEVALGSVVYAGLQLRFAALRKTPKVAISTKATTPPKERTTWDVVCIAQSHT